MYVKVHVTPKAKKEKVLKESDTVYRIMVKEPAEQNLANRRTRELLANELGIQKGKLRLISGHRSPVKVFSINSEE